MQRQQAPFRADIVGSFCARTALNRRVSSWLRGLSTPLSYARLRITRSVIWFSSNATAACMWSPTVSFVAHGGISISSMACRALNVTMPSRDQFNGVQTKAHGVRVTGKLAFGDHPMLEDFRYLKSISGDAQPKMTIPSPSVLHFRGGRKDIDATVYPDLSDYFDDLATTWRDAIRAFYDAGCRYLQLDDTVWAYLCSDAQRQQVRERGEDPMRWRAFMPGC